MAIINLGLYQLEVTPQGVDPVKDDWLFVLRHQSALNLGSVTVRCPIGNLNVRMPGMLFDMLQKYLPKGMADDKYWWLVGELRKLSSQLEKGE